MARQRRPRGSTGPQWHKVSSDTRFVGVDGLRVEDGHGWSSSGKWRDRFSRASLRLSISIFGGLNFSSEFLSISRRDDRRTTSGDAYHIISSHATLRTRLLSATKAAYLANSYPVLDRVECRGALCVGAASSGLDNAYSANRYRYTIHDDLNLLPRPPPA